MQTQMGCKDKNPEFVLKVKRSKPGERGHETQQLASRLSQTSLYIDMHLFSPVCLQKNYFSVPTTTEKQLKMPT